MTITNNKNYNEDDEEQVQSLRTVERNSLLPQYYIRNPCSNSNSASAFLRKHLPITRSHHRHRKSARHFRTNSTFLSALDKVLFPPIHFYYVICINNGVLQTAGN